jgi:multicomponent Na+:H+ antiporter subunit E
MATDPPQRRTAGGFVWLWILLTLVWIAATSSPALESIAAGALISAVLAHVLARRFPAWSDVRFTPRRLYHFLRYTGVFLIELARANLNMLRYVYAPRIDISPGIVRISTRLRTPVGRLALASSIALTPGSLVVDIDGSDLFIHWLDIETTDQIEATRLIAGPFEDHLEKAFG